jgi:hypothetical protein
MASNEADRPTLKITPDMIEAGAEILFAQDALNGVMDMGYGRLLTQQILLAALCGRAKSD